VHKSEFEVFIVGDIAEGGGDFKVVSETEVELTVLFVVDSVTIGTGLSASVVVGVVGVVVWALTPIEKKSMANIAINLKHIFDAILYTPINQNTIFL